MIVAIESEASSDAKTASVSSSLTAEASPLAGATPAPLSPSATTTPEGPATGEADRYSADGYIDVGVWLRGHTSKTGQRRFGSFGDVSNDWRNGLSGGGARVFPFYIARLLFCDFRD